MSLVNIWSVLPPKKQFSAKDTDHYFERWKSQTKISNWDTAWTHLNYFTFYKGPSLKREKRPLHTIF